MPEVCVQNLLPFYIDCKSLNLKLDVAYKRKQIDCRYCQIHGNSISILNFMGLFFKKLPKYRVNVSLSVGPLSLGGQKCNCWFKTNFFKNEKELKRKEDNYCFPWMNRFNFCFSLSTFGQKSVCFIYFLPFISYTKYKTTTLVDPRGRPSVNFFKNVHAISAKKLPPLPIEKSWIRHWTRDENRAYLVNFWRTSVLFVGTHPCFGLLVTSANTELMLFKSNSFK